MSSNTSGRGPIMYKVIIPEEAFRLLKVIERETGRTLDTIVYHGLLLYHRAVMLGKKVKVGKPVKRPRGGPAERVGEVIPRLSARVKGKKTYE